MALNVLVRAHRHYTKADFALRRVSVDDQHVDHLERYPNLQGVVLKREGQSPASNRRDICDCPRVGNRDVDLGWPVAKICQWHNDLSWGLRETNLDQWIGDSRPAWYRIDCPPRDHL